MINRVKLIVANKRWLSSLAALGIIGVFLLHTAFVHASFQANNLMDDGVFNNVNSMNASQIDNWLNANFPSSCISTNNGFSSPDPTGYNPSQGFLYGGNVSAGQVIYDSAQAYGLNPQVILATLEKESSVVSGDASYHCQYINTAMGYGCPDSGNCPTNPATMSGFSKQVIHAAWLLKFGEERSEGNTAWAVIKGNWDNSDDPPTCYGGPMTQGTFSRGCGQAATYYDGYTTIDGSSVHMDTGATAALYWYTPHFSGNQHFDSIFESYFGGIYAAPYSAAYYSQSSYPQLNPGQQTTSYFMYQNTGGQAWYDDTSIGSAPAGSYPVHLATSQQLNRASSFDSGWPTFDRPALNFAAVYLADGTTLSSNQHVVEPGQIVEFSFTLTAPSGLAAGTYPECFTPVAEGAPVGTFSDPGTCLNVTVNAIPGVSWGGQSNYPTVAPDTKSAAYVLLVNSGSVPLYDDTSIGSAPAGSYPVHLATSNPLNSNSAFSADWPSQGRASYNFAAVYNSDGVTLASNQHVAQPGQIVKFTFDFIPPVGYAAGTYQQYLQPILEGTSDGYFPNLGISWTITVPTTAVIGITNSPSISLVSNQPGQVVLNLENVGNSASSSNTSLTTTTGSQFSNSSWVSTNNVASLGQSLAPGASMNLTVPLLAPTTSASINTSFDANFSVSGNALPSALNSIVGASVAGTAYTASFFNQAPYPSLLGGQVASVYFMYQNTGNQPWYDDSSISGATWRNAMPTHLATANNLNRASAFDSGWPNVARPANTFAAVYNSDGVTLASNQHVAQPGQIVKFSFNISPPPNLPAGVYPEYFQPIIEGTSDGAINYIGTSENITVLPSTYTDAYFSQSDYPTLSPGQQAAVWLEYQNTGNQPWYDDSSINSAPSGTYPVHLATNRLLNRASAFDSGWPNVARPANTFAAVYNSDGVTLASNQHVAQPGQIVKFSFMLAAPTNIAPGTYPEYFVPVAEGSSTGLFNDPGTVLNITVP